MRQNRSTNAAYIGKSRESVSKAKNNCVCVDSGSNTRRSRRRRVCNNKSQSGVSNASVILLSLERMRAGELLPTLLGRLLCFCRRHALEAAQPALWCCCYYYHHYCRVRQCAVCLYAPTSSQYTRWAHRPTYHPKVQER